MITEREGKPHTDNPNAENSLSLSRLEGWHIPWDFFNVFVIVYLLIYNTNHLYNAFSNEVYNQCLFMPETFI